MPSWSEFVCEFQMHQKNKREWNWAEMSWPANSRDMDLLV